METPKELSVRGLSREQLLAYMQPFFEGFVNFNNKTPQELLKLQTEFGLPPNQLPMTRLQLVEKLAYEQKKQTQARMANFFLENIFNSTTDNLSVLREIEGIAITEWTIHQILHAVAKERITIEEWLSKILAASTKAEGVATEAEEELETARLDYAAVVADENLDAKEHAKAKKAAAKEKHHEATTALKSIVVKTESLKYFTGLYDSAIDGVLEDYDQLSQAYPNITQKRKGKK